MLFKLVFCLNCKEMFNLVLQVFFLFVWSLFLGLFISRSIILFFPFQSLDKHVIHVICGIKKFGFLIMAFLFNGSIFLYFIIGLTLNEYIQIIIQLYHIFFK
jgi:hypothetical protein